MLNKKKNWILKYGGLILVGSLLVSGCGSSKNTSENGINSEINSLENAADAVSSESQVNEEGGTGITFPYELDGGNLVVHSVFPSDIDNPDADHESGENIVSVEITNKSDKCLVNANLNLTLTDGQIVPVVISYLPAGESVWAFATDNTSSQECICEAISIEPVYSEDDLMLSDRIATEVDNTQVNLTNISGEDLYNLTIYCHCNMDDVLLGGSVYTYSVEYISAGDTVSVTADDCFLGQAEVVCITNN